MPQAIDELDAAVGPSDRPGDSSTEPCAVCGGPTVLCCSGCEDIFYCSVNCQQKDWARHRLTCNKKSTQVAQQVSKALAPVIPAEPQEIPLYKQEIALAGKEHAARGAEEKRERLRGAAVAASRDRRYMDVLDSAMQAYQMGSAETRRRTAGEPDVDLNQLIELLLLARATHVAGEHASGLKYLDHLAKMVDSLTGADGNLPVFHPWAAATLLLCTAELCTLFGQQERATDYSRAYMAMARLAHGEGSPAVGDAYGFHAALLVRRGCLEEALHHTMMMLQVRQRCGDDKSIADAHWNIGAVLRELHQYKAAIESLEAAREIYSRCSGEGLDSSQADIATASVLQLLGEHQRAVEILRQAVRARQRTFGFANLETKRAAELLADAEAKLHHEADVETVQAFPVGLGTIAQWHKLHSEDKTSKVELPATVEMERQWSSLRISKADTFHAGFKTVWEALEAISAIEASCAGYLHLSDESSRHRLVGFQPPTGEASTVQLSYEGDNLHEDVPRFGRRTWRRLPDSGTRAVVLELIGEPNRSLCRQGYWLIAGDRFARIIGLNNEGIIDRYCCSSLGQLEKMFGSECIEQELDSHYEACCPVAAVVSGILVTPGHFRVEHEVPRGQAEAGETFLDVESGIGGKIELPSKIGGEVLHHGPKGIQRWRVLELGTEMGWKFQVSGHRSYGNCEVWIGQAWLCAFVVAALARRNGEKLVQEQLPQEIQVPATEAAPLAAAQVAEAMPETTEAPDDNVLDDDRAEEELQERDPLPANFKFPQAGFRSLQPWYPGYPPPDQVSGEIEDFPALSASVATEEEKAAVLAAVASAAAAGALPPGTKQAVVIPSAVGGAPIVLSTYRTALEGMSASQIAEALSEQVLPARSSLPPASALIAAAGAFLQVPMAQVAQVASLAPVSLPMKISIRHHCPPDVQEWRLNAPYFKLNEVGRKIGAEKAEKRVDRAEPGEGVPRSPEPRSRGSPAAPVPMARRSSSGKKPSRS
eukprot:s625_g3.t1